MAGLQAVAEVEEAAALSPQSTRDAAMAASLAAAAVMLTFAAACVTILVWVVVAILVAFAA